jgi:hypothetical protein
MIKITQRYANNNKFNILAFCIFQLECVPVLLFCFSFFFQIQTSLVEIKSDLSYWYGITILYVS